MSTTSSHKKKKKKKPAEFDFASVGDPDRYVNDYPPYLGRPTDYDPKYCKMLIAHAKKPGGNFHSFAASIGTNRHRLYEWAKKHKDFRDAKDTAKEIQEDVMFKLGLNGMQGKVRNGWQAAWMFAMKARHHYREEGNDSPDDDEETDMEFEYE